MERDGPSVPPPQRRQVPPLCPATAALRLSPHCHLRSLSPVRGSLSLAALLALPPVKRCSRAAQGVFGVVARDGRLSSGGYPPSPSFPTYVILTCPPTHVSQACSNVDCTIREALESILGRLLLTGPPSPAVEVVFNLWSASLHAPATFLSSSLLSQT